MSTHSLADQVQRFEALKRENRKDHNDIALIEARIAERETELARLAKDIKHGLDFDNLVDTPQVVSAEQGTKEAAVAIISRAHTLRSDALAAICSSPDGLTADEVAARLGASVLAVRPRITELFSEGLIQKKDRCTRPSISGRAAQVWVYADQD